MFRTDRVLAALPFLGELGLTVLMSRADRVK